MNSIKEYFLDSEEDDNLDIESELYHLLGTLSSQFQAITNTLENMMEVLDERRE